MWGYYDESGEYDFKGTLVNITIGGLFAPLDRWQAFDGAWQKALADEGLTYFHMSDFEAWKRPFDFKLSNGERDKAKHNRLLTALLDILLDQVDGLYAFGAVSMYDPDKPPLTHAALMEDCVGGAIKNAVLDVADFYQEPLNLVFGKQKHFGESKIRRFVDFYDYGDEQGRIRSSRMAEPKDVRPLQAADILAYEMARAQRAGRPERYPFQRLIDGAKARDLRMVMTWGPIRSRRLDLSSGSRLRRRNSRKG